MPQEEIRDDFRLLEAIGDAKRIMFAASFGILYDNPLAFLPDKNSPALSDREVFCVAGGPGAFYTALGWSFGLNENLGNMTATGPAFVTSGTTEDVTVNWNGLAPDTIYLGGISHNTPQGLSAITVIRIGN